MKRIAVFVVALAAVLAGCGKEEVGAGSQLVVLYRQEVAPGTSIVSFVNYNDPTGQFATRHCEELRAIYSNREPIPYFCSTIVFEGFRPTFK